MLNAKDPSWLGFGSRLGVYRLQPAALLDPCNVLKVGFTEDEKIKSLKQCILDLHVKDSEESQSEIPAMPLPTVAANSLEQMVTNEIQRYLSDVLQNKKIY